VTLRSRGARRCCEIESIDRASGARTPKDRWTSADRILISPAGTSFACTNGSLVPLGGGSLHAIGDATVTALNEPTLALGNEGLRVVIVTIPHPGPWRFLGHDADGNPDYEPPGPSRHEVRVLDARGETLAIAPWGSSLALLDVKRGARRDLPAARSEIQRVVLSADTRRVMAQWQGAPRSGTGIGSTLDGTWSEPLEASELEWRARRGARPGPPAAHRSADGASPSRASLPPREADSPRLRHGARSPPGA
jgi:hypothetical protein